LPFGIRFDRLAPNRSATYAVVATRQNPDGENSVSKDVTVDAVLQEDERASAVPGAINPEQIELHLMAPAGSRARQQALV
jgi:hypothetical protein